MSLFKWKSEVGEINLKNVFDNISLTTNSIKLRNVSINFHTESSQQSYFVVRIEIKESYQYIATVIMPYTLYFSLYIWLCPVAKVFWQQVMVIC